MAKALIVVDVQNDFCEGGSLAVEGGIQAAQDIRRYLEESGDDYDLVVATRDWHDPNSENGGHIADEPDFVDTWPAHCVSGTVGADYHPELWPASGEYPHDEVKKGQGFPAYSGFEGVNADGEGLRDLLDNRNVTRVDIVGIAFDYCVKATAIDATTSGMKVRVLKDMTAAIHQDGSADEMLAAAGVAVVENARENTESRQADRHNQRV